MEVWALPTGESAISGNIQFERSGKTLNINTNNERAIAEYLKFNIAEDETVNFNLPGNRSAILNRVTGGEISEILGRLNSNGHVFLVNPAGIIFGQNAQVNVQSITASTLDIHNDDFLSGNLTFQHSSNAPGGKIVNHGQINAQQHVVMMAGAIENHGQVQAPNIQLAVGDRITMQVADNVLIDVTVDESLKNRVEQTRSAIANSGNLSGKNINLQAHLAEALYETTVNNTGVIEAIGLAADEAGNIQAVGRHDTHDAIVINTGIIRANANTAQGSQAGHITLDGDITLQAGLLEAKGAGTTGGGTVDILGESIELASDSQVNVSAEGASGNAGRIHVGGNYQGQGPLRTAQSVTVEADVRLQANGAQHGNGGRVETSGKKTLSVLGSASVKASEQNSKGAAGEWLLDPSNMTIFAGSGVDSGTGVYADNIQSTLNTGTNVTVQTSDAGVGEGNLTVNGGVNIQKTAGGDATLALKAHKSILFNGSTGSPITVQSTTGKLNITLNADTDQGSDGGVGGAIQLDNTTLISNGGNITLGGGSNPLTQNARGTSSHNRGVYLRNNTTLNAAAGNIAIRGEGYDDAAQSFLYGTALSQNSHLYTTSGTVNITGVAGDGIENNHGILVYDNGGIHTQSGNITLNGTGGTGTRWNVGVRGGLNNATIESVNGNITLTGQGGNGSQNGNHGVHFDLSGKIKTTGTGNIQFTGTAGTGTNTNAGIALQGSGTEVSTTNGSIGLAGQGGNGSQDANFGILINTGAKVKATSVGSMTLTGTGGNGTQANHGIMISGTQTDVSSQNGNINLTGQGGGSVNTNHGVRIESNAKVRALGSGNITATGTGGNGNTYNYGTTVLYGGQLTTTTGNLTVTGTGGTGITSYNYGVLVYDSGLVHSDSGALSVTGTSGTGTSVNHGVHVALNNAEISTINGTLAVTGNTQGTGDSNFGVSLATTGKIKSTGTGMVTVTGTGANGGSQNHGINLLDNNSEISSTNGNLNVTGTAGNGSGTTNRGINNTSGAKIASLGTGNLLMTATGNTSSNGNALRNDAAEISTQGGTLTINAHSPGAHALNNNAGGVINSHGGNMILTGTSQTTRGIQNLDSSILSEGGSLTLSGTSVNDYGILNTGTGLIHSATGQLILTGTSTDQTAIGLIGTSRIQSSSGNITLNGIRSNVGNGNLGINIITGDILSSTGNIVLNTDRLDIRNGVQTGGNITIQTPNASDVYFSTTNGVSNDVTAGYLDLSTSELGYLSFGNTLSIEGQNNLYTTAFNLNGYTQASNKTLRLQANNNVNIAGNISDSNTGSADKLNLIIQANADNTGLGTVNINGATLQTYGGNITIDNNTNGTTTDKGVSIDSATLSSGGGNIAITGKSQDNNGLHHVNSTMQSGGGSITLNGTSTVAEGIFNETGGQIQSGGGDITLTGSSTQGMGIRHDDNSDILSSNGTIALTGNSTQEMGIRLIDNVSINAGTGNISITGNSQNDMGVQTYNNAIVQSNGGSIQITGTSVDNIALNNNTNSQILSNGGNITLTGTSTNNIGVNNISNAVISSGSGNILITGNSGSEFGIRNATNSTISATSGEIDLRGGSNARLTVYNVGGSQITSTSGNIRLTSLNNNNPGIGITSGLLQSTSGNVYLTSDRVRLEMPVVTGGNVYFKTNTGTQIRLGGTVDNNDSATQLHLSAAELDRITANTVMVGDVASSNAVTFEGLVDLRGSTGTAGTYNLNINTNSNFTGTAGYEADNTNLNILANGGIQLGSTFSTNGTGTISMVTPGNIVLNPGASVRSQATGNSIVLASTGGSFINNAGGTALQANNGRWLVYSDTPTNTTEGGLTYNKIYNKTYAGNPPASIPAGNHILYSIAPVLTITADAKSRTYGDNNPLLTGTLNPAGLLDGDTALTAFTGSATYTTPATAASNVGIYAIQSGLGSLASSLGYQFNVVDNTLTVNKAPLTITANGVSKTYGSDNPALTATYSGFKLGQNANVLDTQASFSTAAHMASNVGLYHIQVSGAQAQNYDIQFNPGVLTIDKASLHVKANDAIRLQGEINPAFSAHYKGFVLGDGQGMLGGPLLLRTNAISTSLPGRYPIVPSGLTAQNYTLQFEPGTLTVTPLPSVVPYLLNAEQSPNTLTPETHQILQDSMQNVITRQAARALPTSTSKPFTRNNDLGEPFPLLGTPVQHGVFPVFYRRPQPPEAQRDSR